MNPQDIKRLRQNLGFSQEKFARDIGVSFCTVNRWERGKSSPSPMAAKILKRLSERTDVSNRRASVRLDMRYPIDVHALGAADGRVKKPADSTNRFFSSYTENISTGGLMFKDTDSLKEGDSVRVFVNLGEKNHVEALSEVVWARESKNAKSAGVRFSNLSQEDMSRLMNAMLLN